ncbi:MAG: glycosyltransferase family 39 protein, partial [Desulfuromonadales bacterium]|nr:glycosyltransferase family 39 protein [Desulfuromonadales bacterium]
MAEKRSLLWLCGLLVALCGALLGAFAWNTHFKQFDRIYEMSFRDAKVIVAPDDATQGYFRRELFVGEQPRSAWLALATSETFSLYVNGKHVGYQDAMLLNTSAAFDIAAYLKPGKNIVALKVQRKTRTGQAWFLLEGGWKTGLSEESFRSDESWFASSTEPKKRYENIAWFAPAYDHSLWRQADVATDVSSSPVLTLPYPTALLHYTSDKEWIGHPDSSLRTVLFQQQWRLERLPADVWLLLASSGESKVLINGRAVDSGALDNQTAGYVNVRPYLQPGVNTLSVRVHAATEAAPKLLAEILSLQRAGLVSVLSTDRRWTVSSANKPDNHAAIVLSAADPSAPRFRVSPASLMERPLSTRESLALPLMILLGAVGSLLLWLCTPWLSSRIGAQVKEQSCLVGDALYHLLPLLVVSALFLAQFDPKIGPETIFNKTTLLLALLLFIAVKCLSLWSVRVSARYAPNADGSTHSSLLAPLKKMAPWAILLLLLILGLSLRVELAGLTSLSHDEVGIARMAESVLERGYPVNMIGSILKPLTTYEILPYPVALSMLLFGKGELAVRLPSILFGLATSVLIFWVGRRLWGEFTGLFAVAIYTFSPLALLWGTNSFHPQQAQFFCLLTSYLFLNALQARFADRRMLALATVSFVLTYLSWEGSGILLPALFVGMLSYYGTDFSWIRSRRLWLAVTVIGLVVVLQLGVRFLANMPFLLVGAGLVGKTLSLAFLSPEYDLWFYLRNFLFSGYQFVLTLLVLLGLPFFWGDKKFRFIVVVGATLVFLLTNFMPNISTRYTYFILPYLLLAASYVAFRLTRWKEIVAAGEPVFLLPPVFRFCFVGAILLCAFLFTNTYLVNPYHLGPDNSWMKSSVPPIADYKGAANYVTEHMRPGDKVIALMPHAFE